MGRGGGIKVDTIGEEIVGGGDRREGEREGLGRAGSRWFLCLKETVSRD